MLSAELVKIARECGERHKEIAAGLQSNLAKVLEQGSVLFHARERMKKNGLFLEFIKVASLTQSTAYRYINTFEKWDDSNKELSEGQSLISVYRQFGLVKALPAQGARDGKAAREARKQRHLAEQCEFNFDFFNNALTFTVNSSARENPFEKVGLEDLRMARERATQALALIEAALVSKEEAINL